MLRTGDRIPSATVALLINGEPERANIRNLVGQHAALIVGVPQAFTPVCSHEHLPAIADALPALRRAGLTRFLVVAPDNPWAMDRWRREFAFGDEFLWVSDGNRDFAAACGVQERYEQLFLGDCTRRYAIQAKRGVVYRFVVETDLIDVACTSADEQVRLADDDVRLLKV